MTSFRLQQFAARRSRSDVPTHNGAPSHSSVRDASGVTSARFARFELLLSLRPVLDNHAPRPCDDGLGPTESAPRHSASLPPMDAEASPSRSITGHLRGALSACRGAWRTPLALALDIALPTLCVACREPVPAKASAQSAGPNCRSSRHRIARGSAFPLSTIPDRSCCRWRRSPIRRPTSAPAPRCAMTTSRARWCMR